MTYMIYNNEQSAFLQTFHAKRYSLERDKEEENAVFDYKFRPLTTRRCNLALQKHRELLKKGALIYQI